LLEVYLQLFQKPKSFASIDSNTTPPRLGLMEDSLTDRFSRGSIVGPTGLMVLHRPVELAGTIGKWKSAPDAPGHIPIGQLGDGVRQLHHVYHVYLAEEPLLANLLSPGWEKLMLLKPEVQIGNLGNSHSSATRLI
jgi:hypothetical protein